MKKALFMALPIALFLTSASAWAANADCIQIIQNAKNPSTGECKAFPTPCDVPSGWEDVESCKSSGSGTQELKVNFSVKTFSSCDNYESIMKDFIRQYYKAHPYNGGYYRGYDLMMEDTVGSSVKGDVAAPVANGAAEQKVSNEASNYSQTNIQVGGVDESDIVKNNGKYIYYYDSKDRSVYILNAFPANELKVAKRITLPDTFVSPELYLDANKLTIVATKYSNTNLGYYWFTRNVKTIVVTYDITDLENLKLEKYYLVDGSYSKSRKIGDYVYVLSQSNFNFPYNTYYDVPLGGEKMGLDEKKLDADLVPKKILPKKAELRITDNSQEQNVKVHGKSVPYNLSNDYVAKCSDIEYVIPDQATIEKFEFTPSFVTLSIVDTKNPDAPVKSKLLFGDVAETYMSLENLYISSNLYTSYDFKCPQVKCISGTACPIVDCYFPYYSRGENTLLHKISISKDTTKYRQSTIVPGSPLNQYSMDEKDGNFRIVTRSSYPNQSTNVYVLDSSMKSIGKLEGLAKDENFQSARFIGDRLYLVTFQQIDPLFTIDLKDPTQPKVLGELKIPGFSTYLHPYDETTLIGLGYDTGTGAWGGVTTSGLKIDLYDVGDVSSPKQKYSLTLGDHGSTSPVLTNPRLFTWDKQNKRLFMPVTLYTSAHDKTNTYRNADVFQGSVALKVDKESGISELSRVSHIDTTGIEQKWKEECAKYSGTEKPQCQKLIGGGEYCPSETYVPPYCYVTSTVGEYIANQIYSFSDSFVQRNLYMDNIWYTLSNTKVQANDMNDSYKKVSETKIGEE